MLNVDTFKKGLGKNNNTYKFVLALSILQHVKNNPNSHEISYNYICDYFIQFYWNHITKYHIKHSTRITLEPRIISSIREFCKTEDIDGLSFSYFKRHHSTKLERLKEMVKSEFDGFINNPLSRIHTDYTLKNNTTGDPEGSASLFSWSESNQSVTLGSESLAFFKQNHTSLHAIVILQCTKFLEKYNYIIPKLTQKIDSDGKRHPFKSSTKKLFAYQEGDHCFYCESALTNQTTEIEHFIPHEFVLEHKPWNLIQSCTTCNRGKDGKHTKLPRKSIYLDKLIHRNEIEFENTAYKMHNDFQSIHDMKEGIYKIYQACLDAGYQTWWTGPSNYNVISDSYIAETQSLDLTELYSKFERYLSPGDRILDVGCGSGRDSLYFIEQQYEVEALEQNLELFAHCCKSSVLSPVIYKTSLQDYATNRQFNAVWACATLLHLSDAELEDSFAKLNDLLHEEGVIYMSFKEGLGEAIVQRNYINYQTEATIKSLLPASWTILESWISQDVRADKSTSWLNFILRV